MGKTPDKHRPPTDSTAFNGSEYSRLRTLNEQLAEAEQWIDRRSREMVTAYGIAAAQARCTDRLDEGVELIATILFLRREGHEDFRPECHNMIVTRIDIPILPAISENLPSTGTHAASSFPTGNEEWCQLFLNLYERALQGDTFKLLSIGALCVDVALIQQQQRSW